MAIVWQIAYIFTQVSVSLFSVHIYPPSISTFILHTNFALCMLQVQPYVCLVSLWKRSENFPTEKSSSTKKDVICCSLHYKIGEIKFQFRIPLPFGFTLAAQACLLFSEFSFVPKERTRSRSSDCYVALKDKLKHWHTNAQHKHTHTQQHALKNDKFESSFPVLCLLHPI